jgi:glutathione S-transferase
MNPQPTLTLHALPPSHPCLTAQAALDYKGLDYERVDLKPGEHPEQIAELYGEGKTTVPGLMVGDEPVHGSVAILERLEELAPEPALYPEPIADRVREAERWGDDELQDLGRRLPFGALHFRPEAMGTFGGAPLDPAGTDFAIGYVRGGWKYHKITAVRLAEDLTGLPEKLDYVDALAAEGIVNGDEPTAADLQIGATLRVLTCLGDLRGLLEGRPCDEIARRWFPDYSLDIPAGAYPEGWVPARG